MTDRLIGAAVDQLRRPIGGEKHQPLTGQAGFDQRGIKVRRRGAGRDDHRHRLTRRLRQPKRQMAEPALIKMGMTDKRSVGRSGQRQRRRARSRSDTNMPYPMAGQRLEQHSRPPAIKNTCRHSSLTSQLAEIVSGAADGRRACSYALYYMRCYFHGFCASARTPYIPGCLHQIII